MLSREEIKAQVIQQRMAGIEAEVDRRYEHALEQRKLQNCGFHNSNIDDVIERVTKSPISFRKGMDHMLPSFEFKSKEKVKTGRYSFCVGNATFFDSLVEEISNGSYRCNDYLSSDGHRTIKTTEQ